jgi:hypothetical protein
VNARRGNILPRQQGSNSRQSFLGTHRFGQRFRPPRVLQVWTFIHSLSLLHPVIRNATIVFEPAPTGDVTTHNRHLHGRRRLPIPNRPISRDAEPRNIASFPPISASLTLWRMLHFVALMPAS